MDGLRVNRQSATWADKKYGNQPDGKIKTEKSSPSIIKPCVDKKNHLPINIIKRSIRRAWTINGPFDYWASARVSSSARIYRSLPLHRNACIKPPNQRKRGEIAENSPTRQVDSAIKSRINIYNKRNQTKTKVQLSNIENKSSKRENKFSLLRPKSLGDYKSENVLSNTSVNSPFSRCVEKTTPEVKTTPKYGEKKSNIPVFRRNFREFEDIATLRTSAKRSLTAPSAQRYRGSADDLRGFRQDDVGLPSLIPKLSTPLRDKDTKIKRCQVASDYTSRFTSPEAAIKRIQQDDVKISHKFVRLPTSSMTDSIKIKFNNSRQVKEPVQTREDEDDDEDEGNRRESKLPEASEETEVKEEFVLNDNVSMSVGEDSETLDARVENPPDSGATVNTDQSPSPGKKVEPERKHSKEESFNTDDTDDAAPSRRWSSHLSPEASPLSTRSSKYSPRESESEPTPALARKTGTSSSESCISSQRIRDAITRTRRESNSSARYESSGSESIRLSESGFHDYVDLAKRVRIMGNHYYCPRISVENDEPVQRDSATSAGEDESHEDCDPARFSSASASQNRTILRRRRQFDAQGSRRRGRSHVRTCCSDELTNLQISRQESPLSNRGAIHGQDLPNPDYRRLVFISSDSSSGREEDDADSSCSSSSYLNGLPRNSHAQSVEDCDWDYFESDTLQLSSVLSHNFKKTIGARLNSRNRDWNCCLGRGSTACLACGGSPGRNVLPVPVPIPVPVPYPVPVPAALWNNGNFAATASSMITSSSEAISTKFTGIEQALPWFSWHPRFYQPEPPDRTIGAGATAATAPDATFDPSNILTFRPNEILLGPYGIINNDHNNLVISSFINTSNLANKSTDTKNPEKKTCGKIESEEELSSIRDSLNETVNLAQAAAEKMDKIVSADENNVEKDEIIYSDSRENSGSSSGRSSADSSDLDESSPRFSGIFVVNDDSLTNDDTEDGENIHLCEVASSKEDNGIVLKSITHLSDDEPMVLQSNLVEPNKSNMSSRHCEMYIAKSIDYDDDHVELKSIRPLNPEEIQYPSVNLNKELDFYDNNEKYDSNVMPDSLEVAETTKSKDYFNYSLNKSDSITKNTSDGEYDNNSTLNSTILSTNSETNTTDSEISSDELHEYQLSNFESLSSSSSSPETKMCEESVKSMDNMLSEDCEPNNDTWSRFSERESTKLAEQIQSVNEGPPVSGKKSPDGEQVRSVGENDSAASGNGPAKATSGEETVQLETSRFRLVERRPPTRSVLENASPPKSASIAAAHDPTSSTQTFNSNNKYTSLVMITSGAYQPVSVITSDTTTLLQPDGAEVSQGLAGYYHLALEAVTDDSHQRKGRKPLTVKRITAKCNEEGGHFSADNASESDERPINTVNNNKTRKECSNVKMNTDEEVSDEDKSLVLEVQSSIDVVNTANTNEEGLADDDSWLDEASHDEDDQSATTATEESSEDEVNSHLGDHEEELRGYHRQAIDFTLHTIVEESCEESEAEPSFGHAWKKKQRPPSASDLEKYFFFGLGGDSALSSNLANSNSVSTTSANGGNASGMTPELDSLSETSSVYSEGLESLGQDDLGPVKEKGGNEFANSSRLEKYFLSEFLGFDQDRRDSDGSVGSDSEGRPSPEAQRRKRLVRARGTGRSHSSSLDNLLALTHSNQNLSSQNSLQDLSMNQDSQDTQSGDSSTETDCVDDGQTALFGVDGQFDTVKRKKKKPRNLGSQSPRVVDDLRNKSPELRDTSFGKLTSTSGNDNNNDQIINLDDDISKTPEPELTTATAAVAILATPSSSIPDINNQHNNINEQVSVRNKQQSRDSGFIGSCDDLLQHQKPTSTENKIDNSEKNNAKDYSLATHNRDSIASHDASRDPENSASQQAHSSRSLNANASLSRKDSFNNWSSDEETNLMMSKMRQFFKTMVANSNGQQPAVNPTANHSNIPSPSPSPRLSGYPSAKPRLCPLNRTKPPQLVYFENELTRLMKTVPGIRDEQVREIVEYLSSEDTWSDSYDSSDYTSSDLEGAAGGRRSALQEQISQSCQQIINKFDITTAETLSPEKAKEHAERKKEATKQAEDDEDEEDEDDDAVSVPSRNSGRRDTAFVYQKLVQSFTKMASDSSHANSDASLTPHSSPPLIAKVMHHIGSRLVALMHQVSENNSTAPAQHPTWRRYAQHHRASSSASTTEDDDSTSDSAHTSTPQFQLPRSKSHDPLLLINGHPVAASQEGEEREASDYERFSWRGSFESALMAADSRTKLSLLACSGDVNASSSANALAMAAKRRSAGDLLFNPKSFSREQLDRVRSCGSIGGGGPMTVGNAGGGGGGGVVDSIEEKIWNSRRRSSVPDANIRGESGASAGDDDTEDELEHTADSRATTLPRGIQATTPTTATTNSLPRLPASSSVTPATTTASPMHKAHSMYHFLPQHTNVKSARYRPPGFARNSNSAGPKRAFSAPGLELAGAQSTGKSRESGARSRRREQAISLMADDGSSLSEACSTPIIGGTSPRLTGRRAIADGDLDSVEHGTLHSSHHGASTRASLSSLGARSDSMASVYSGAGEGRWCGSVSVRGEVEFSMQYDYKQLSFQVHISQCRDLAAVDTKRNRSDPYVKVYLLPDKSKGGKRKTKVKKHTLNPVFDETLKFHMSLNGLETRTLWLTVWHSDMFGRNDFLGEVRMPLENKIFDDPTPRWYPLQERSEAFDDPISYKGEVIVGLKFVPPDPVQLERERDAGGDSRLSKGKKNWSRGSLHVLVKEARNLQTRAKHSGTCDPFCKSYLLPDKGRSGKHKTNVVRRSGGSPVWNHTIVYKDVSLQELAERGLELTVWDHDRIASNEFLGGVRFNLGSGKHYGKSVDWMDATGRELSLWQSMIERPNFWVEGAVALRPNLHNHGKNGSTF